MSDRGPLAGTQFSHLHPQGMEPLRFPPALKGYSSKVLNTSTLSSGQGQPPAAWRGIHPSSSLLPLQFPSWNTHARSHTYTHTHTHMV